jgi:hypothetical protein
MEEVAEAHRSKKEPKNDEQGISNEEVMSERLETVAVILRNSLFLVRYSSVRLPSRRSRLVAGQ